MLGQNTNIPSPQNNLLIIKVETSVALAFTNRSGFELRDEENQILLNAGAIDTSSATLQALRSATISGAPGEKRLHLVQFAGPVKPEWYEALVTSGVQIVNYIPHNAYLVYGDVESLNDLKSWAAQASQVHVRKNDPLLQTGTDSGFYRLRTGSLMRCLYWI